MVPNACASLDVEICSEQPRLAASDGSRKQDAAAGLESGIPRRLRLTLSTLLRPRRCGPGGRASQHAAQPARNAGRTKARTADQIALNTRHPEISRAVQLALHRSREGQRTSTKGRTAGQASRRDCEMMVGFAFPARRTHFPLLQAVPPRSPPARGTPRGMSLNLDELLEHLVGGAVLRVSGVPCCGQSGGDRGIDGKGCETSGKSGHPTVSVSAGY